MLKLGFKLRPDSRACVPNHSAVLPLGSLFLLPSPAPTPKFPIAPNTSQGVSPLNDNLCKGMDMSGALLCPQHLPNHIFCFTYGPYNLFYVSHNLLFHASHCVEDSRV